MRVILRRTAVVVASGLLLSAGCTPQQSPANEPVSWQLIPVERLKLVGATQIDWRLVADSDLVARARLSVSEANFLALRRHDRVYLSFPLSTSRAYKGDVRSDGIELRY